MIRAEIEYRVRREGSEEVSEGIRIRARAESGKLMGMCARTAEEAHRAVCQALAASADLLAELRALRAAFDAADAEATEAMRKRSLADKRLQDAFFRFRVAHPAPTGFFWESEREGPRLVPLPPGGDAP